MKLKISSVLFFFMQIWMANAYWWLLGVEEISKPNAPKISNCDSLNRSLSTEREIQYCQQNGETVQLIAVGNRRGIIQCQQQFAGSRWNCTTFQGDNLFGKFINDGTRETGFVNAMLVAGAALEVAAACRDENIKECTCSVTGINEAINGTFYLYKCDFDPQAAKNILKTFLNESSDENDVTTAIQKVEIHNHNVGLQLLQNLTRSCRCIGLSGSCNIKSCYYKSPDIEDLGAVLKTRYNSAVKVEVNSSDHLVPVNQNANYDDTNIAHIAKSPSFCSTNTTQGILGTENRECDADSNSKRSCDVLCCDRGYTTVTYPFTEDVCTFVWCCEFVCEEKVTNIVKYYCNS